MLLLKITTTPIEYTLQVEKPALKPLDDVRETIPVKPSTQILRENAGRQDHTRVTGTRNAAEAGNAYQAYPRARAVKSPAAKSVTLPESYNHAMSLEAASSQIPEAFSESWEPPVLPSVAEQPVSADTSMQPELEYVPGRMKVEIEQLAKVDYEYVGGMRYVPASSAPDYEPSSK